MQICQRATDRLICIAELSKKASEAAGLHLVVTHNGAEKAGSPD